jgi:hypothetical protein
MHNDELLMQLDYEFSSRICFIILCSMEVGFEPCIFICTSLYDSLLTVVTLQFSVSMLIGKEKTLYVLKVTLS